MQALSRREETEVIAIARDHAHKACDDVVRGKSHLTPRSPAVEFAACSSGRTVTMPFACRGEIKRMNTCLKDYMSEDRLDSLKLDYIAERSEKGRAAVEKLRQERAGYLAKSYRRGKDGEVEPVPGAVEEGQARI